MSSGYFQIMTLEVVGLRLGLSFTYSGFLSPDYAMLSAVRAHTIQLKFTVCFLGAG